RMSLLEFPPLNSSGKPYAIQEFNGRIITGNVEEFQAVTKCESMSDYPSIERTHLNSLQHCISKNDVAGALVFREADQIISRDFREKDGIFGLIDYISNITEDSKLWPIATFGNSLGHGIIRLRNGLASIVSRIVPSVSQERIDELLQQYSSTTNW
ncbi:hypothetical protein DICVIV_09088, partial [Dictyocaulus viviparus]